MDEGADDCGSLERRTRVLVAALVQFRATAKATGEVTCCPWRLCAATGSSAEDDRDADLATEPPYPAARVSGLR